MTSAPSRSLPASPRRPVRASASPVCAGLALALVATYGADARAMVGYPLELSADGTYLVDQDDRPFFINGDTAWSLIAGLSREDAELYLEDRRQRGFNLVLVNLLEHTYAAHAPANYYRQPPFARPGEFDAPNEAYFAHADWVIRRAGEKGIVVLLAPLYLGFDCGDDGWCQDVQASSLETMRAYGRYVGRRYGRFDNVIWLIGGDADPSGAPPAAPVGIRARLRRLLTGEPGRPAPGPDVRAKVRAFVTGLREEDRVHLLSAHNRPEQSGVEPWPTEGWLDLNTIYTYRHTYPAARREARRRPFKPFFLIETSYENARSSTPLSLRRQAYWSVLSGGLLGHVFGNCEIWGFSHGFCPGSWKAQLGSPGSQTLALVGRLFQSRAFFRLEPDTAQLLATRAQHDDSYSVAARASDGSTIIAYIPTPRLTFVDVSGIRGPLARAWWFNPRTGGASDLGTYPTSGRIGLMPPDDEDWVLVIDSASLRLPPPGTGVAD